MADNPLVSVLQIGSSPYDIKDANSRSAIVTLNTIKQDTLVSGTNIKTIDNNSLLGSGDLTVFPRIDDHTIDSTSTAGVYKYEDNYDEAIVIVNDVQAGSGVIASKAQTKITQNDILYRTYTTLTSSWSNWISILHDITTISDSNLDTTTSTGSYLVEKNLSGGTNGILFVDSVITLMPRATTYTQTLIYDKTYKYRTKVNSGEWSAWSDVIDISGKADKNNTTAGTYKSVTVNSQGIVTAGTNPTTLSGYGITDAKIENGVITLGSNTITPITDVSGKANDNDVVHKGSVGASDEVITAGKVFQGDIELQSALFVDGGASSIVLGNDPSDDNLQDLLNEKALAPLVIEMSSSDTEAPSGTYTSISNALYNDAEREIIVLYTKNGIVYKFGLSEIQSDSYYFSILNAEELYFFSIAIYSDDSYDFFERQCAQVEHTHGNIQSGGTLQTTDITIANGDKLVVTDSSNSNKIARASLSFDGSTTSQVLSKKGTWVGLPSTGANIIYDGSVETYVNAGDDYDTVIEDLQGVLLNNKADKTLQVTITESGGTYSANKTYDEISTALTNGQAVVCILDDMVCYYDYFSGSGSSIKFYFKGIWVDGTHLYQDEIEIKKTSGNTVVSVTETDKQYVQKVSSTDNAVVRFDGTTGAVQNSSAKVTDDGDVILSKVIVHGSNTDNDTRYISSSTATNLFFTIGGVTPFLVNLTEVRSSTGLAGTMNLGTASTPWNGIYGKSLNLYGTSVPKEGNSIFSYVTNAKFNDGSTDGTWEVSVASYGTSYRVYYSNQVIDKNTLLRYVWVSGNTTARVVKVGYTTTAPTSSNLNGLVITRLASNTAIAGQINAMVPEDNLYIVFYMYNTFTTWDFSLVTANTNVIIADYLAVNGGTSSQFLKADGSLDNNTYALSSALPSSSELLPAVTSSDNGKILKVANGTWAIGTESGGGSSFLVVTMTYSISAYSLSKTYSEIVTALSGGQDVVIKYNNYLYRYLDVDSSNNIQFTAADSSNGEPLIKRVSVSSSNVVTVSSSTTGFVHTTGTESIGGSKTFTDDVWITDAIYLDGGTIYTDDTGTETIYDVMDSKISATLGNIETLLAAI